MFEIILEDLKRKFGDKAILSPKELAPILHTSESAQSNMRAAGTFPLPVVKQGAKIGVSVYVLAKWLADGDIPACAKKSEPVAPALPQAKLSVRSKRGANDWLVAMELGVEYQSELIREIQRLNLLERVKDLPKNQTPPDAL